MNEQPPEIPGFEFLRVIGEGAFGVVWLARDSAGHWRAVKVVRRAGKHDSASFDREFKALCAYRPLSSQFTHCVRVLAVRMIEEGEAFCYVMQLADDAARRAPLPENATPEDIGTYHPRTLARVVEKSEHGRLEAGFCRDYGVQLTESLCELHEAGLTHRDVRLENVVLVEGRPVLTDLSLVATRGGREFAGGSGYLAPEGPGEPAADVYSLGKLLYRMTTGRAASDYPKLPANQRALAEKDRREMAALLEVVAKACQANPASRYKDAREFQNALIGLRTGTRPDKHKYAWLWVAGIVAGLAVVLAAVVPWRETPPPKPDLPPRAVATIAESPTPPPVEPAKLSVEFWPPDAAGAELKVDGVPRQMPMTDVEVEPGPHQLVARIDGWPTQEMEVTAKRGATEQVRFLFAEAQLSVSTTPEVGSAAIFIDGEMRGSLPGGKISGLPPGQVLVRLEAEGFVPVERSVRLAPGRPSHLRLDLVRSGGPEAGQPWENSLGMLFKPVEGTRVLFSVWETRKKDWDAFLAGASEAGREQLTEAVRSRKAKDGVRFNLADPYATDLTGYGPDHPVLYVSWDGAQAFCEWLTAKERAAGLLTSGQRYRLPTDEEWSVAAGLRDERPGSPQERDGVVLNHYPWGREWPRPEGAGNFAGDSDGYSFTAPVGSFKASATGLHDLAGNVWEWCEDSYAGSGSLYTARGGGWDASTRTEMQTSFRNAISHNAMGNLYGFRVVVEFER